MSGLHQAFFVIADVSGYTTFLSHAELDHATEIIGDLMNVILRSLRPSLRLTEFEGDAALLHGTTAQVSPDIARPFAQRLRSAKRGRWCHWASRRSLGRGAACPRSAVDVQGAARTRGRSRAS